MLGPGSTVLQLARDGAEGGGFGGLGVGRWALGVKIRCRSIDATASPRLKPRLGSVAKATTTAPQPRRPAALASYRRLVPLGLPLGLVAQQPFGEIEPLFQIRHPVMVLLLEFHDILFLA